MTHQICFLVVLSLVAVLQACVIHDYVKHGDSCSCSLKCLEGSQCLKNETGGLSCQCLPCQVYDSNLKQCVNRGDNENTGVGDDDNTGGGDDDNAEDGDDDNTGDGDNDNTGGGDDDNTGGGDDDNTGGISVPPSEEDSPEDNNPCPKPCGQRKTCVNFPDGDYGCECKTGYVVNDTDPRKCMVPPCSDINPLDLVFVVDSSGSIGANHYPQNFEFIRNILPAFRISEAATKVALVTFGTSVRYIFNLTSDKSIIDKKLKDVPYQGSSSSAHAGLLAALTILTQEKLPGRQGAKKSVVLISDGKSTNRTKTLQAADALKDAGINIFTFGIKPGADQPELIAAASRPDFFLSVQSYDALVTFDLYTANLLCLPPPPPDPVIPCPEPAVMDLHVIVDSSGSIGLDSYLNNFIFLERLIRKYYIAEDGVKVSLITFGTSVREIFKLSADKEYVFEKLQNVPYQGSTTSTHSALRYVLNNLDNAQHGARPGFVFKVALLITDGRSTKPEETQKAVEEAKSSGFIIIVLGVTDSVDKDEILAIASKPEYAFFAENYNLLDDFASETSKIFCKEGQKRKQ